MADKGKFSKAVFARVLAAVITLAAGGALWAGSRYGMFSRLMPDQPYVPDGFFDENATHAFVEFIDAGQGDSVLIGSDEHFMLIDTGLPDDTDKVIGQLVSAGVRTLDYLVITAPTDDRAGGAVEIVSRFGAGTVIVPKLPKALAPGGYYYSALTEYAGYGGTELRTAGDESFTLGSCTFETITPKKEHENIGDHSVFVKLTHGENTFLFTGGSEQPEEEELVGSGAKLRADVLMAGAHGGRSSCCSSLLSAVMPKFTVVSCGKNEDHGAPNRDTLRRIRKFSPTVYITAEDGTVRFESDGCRFKISAGKG